MLLKFNIFLSFLTSPPLSYISLGEFELFYSFSKPDLFDLLTLILAFLGHDAVVSQKISESGRQDDLPSSVFLVLGS